LQCNKSVEEMISKSVTMATKHLTEADHLEEFNKYVSHTSLARYIEIVLWISVSLLVLLYYRSCLLCL